MAANREVVSTESAPAAVGPYSQGIVAGDLVFTAGQLGLEPDTGRLISTGVAAQARQALRNVEAVLEAAGADLGSVVKVTIFLTDMADFAAVNEVYATFFESDPPARSTVAVSSLPLGGRVEVEAVALRRG